MSQLPITSRIKRSPLLKTDPTDPKAKRYGNKEGEDKEIITQEEVKKKKDYVGAENDACSSVYIAKHGDAACKKYKALSQEKKDAANFETAIEEKKETVKGEDLDYDTTIMKTKKEGTMLQPWEVRQQLRGQTRADRQVNKKRRKMEKYGTFDKEGKFTANTDLSARDQRKLQQAETGYGAAQSMSENISTGIKGGRAAKERYFKGQREKLKGEQDETLQLEEAKRLAEKERRDEIAAANNIVTSGQGVKAVEVDNSATTTETEDTPVDTTTYGEYQPAPTSMKPSAFKMKAKSPAVKKLQGNQGRLPQYLQDAIKSAPESPAKLGPLARKTVSSNKMRSGFKMKGYGKK